MKLSYLINNADIQSEYLIYYYDYDKEERIQMSYEQAEDLEIKFIYVEKDCICIEVDYEA